MALWPSDSKENRGLHFESFLFQQIICRAISIGMFVYHWKADTNNKDEKTQAAV